VKRGTALGRCLRQALRGAFCGAVVELMGVCSMGGVGGGLSLLSALERAPLTCIFRELLPAQGGFQAGYFGGLPSLPRVCCLLPSLPCGCSLLPSLVCAVSCLPSLVGALFCLPSCVLSLAFPPCVCCLLPSLPCGCCLLPSLLVCAVSCLFSLLGAVSCLFSLVCAVCDLLRFFVMYHHAVQGGD
jgi:hypothetical protein